MISDNTRIAIKDRTDIVQLAERMGLKLQHEGALFKCCCPFHAEDTPSFKIHPDKQSWRCYGKCNEGGDVIDLYMRLARVEFPQAIQDLAREAGIEIEAFTPEERDATAKRHNAARQFHWLNDLAAQYYAACLKDSANAPALQYLQGRGFTPETIQNFRLGFAPSDGRLRAYVRARLDDRGAGDRWPAVQAAMHECGLLGKNDDGYEYERMRGRVMFPIADRSGHIVGFGGRVMDDKKGSAKYINTAETPIFQKRSLFYALDSALPAIHDQKRILIVEGYVDTIACHQSGIPYATAVLGTALTDSHIAELRRLNAHIFLSFDNDEAGRANAEKAARLLIPAELCFSVCFAPGKVNLIWNADTDTLTVHVPKNPRDTVTGVYASGKKIEFFADRNDRDKNDLWQSAVIKEPGVLRITVNSEFGQAGILTGRDIALDITPAKQETAQTASFNCEYGAKDLGESLLCSDPYLRTDAVDRLLNLMDNEIDGFLWLLQIMLESAKGNDIRRVRIAQELSQLAAQGRDTLLAKARIDRIAKETGLPKSDLCCYLKASIEGKRDFFPVAAAALEGVQGEPVDAFPRAPLPPDDAEAFTDYTDPELPYNDIGAARRLHLLFGERLRFCFPLNLWAFYNGTHWDIRSAGQVKSCMIALSDVVSRFAERERNKELAEYATKSLGSNNKQSAALEVYKGLSGVGVDPEDFDRDLMALPVRNGIIDLVSGQLRPHAPEECITNILQVEYDQSAECPIWLKFIEFITCGRRELQDYLHRAVGYTLTGSTAEQCLFFLYGGGKNGKSVFMEVLRHLLGYLAQKAPIEMITRKDFASTLQPEVAALRGKRFASCSEIGSRMQLDEAKTKDITGGDAISCRTLYSDQFTFKPQFKLWLHGNHKPSIKDADYGIWRRMRLIPFDATVSEADADPDLLQKLLAELPGILAWAIRGCFEWQNSGLDEPDVIKDATKAYQDESNKTGRFLSECCTANESCSATLAQLYTAYEEWCKDGGEIALSKRKFRAEFEQAAAMAKLTLDYSRNNTGMVYKGILLSGIVQASDNF